MGSVLLSSQCPCALLVPNLHPITSPTSSSGHCAASDVSTSVPPKETSRRCYGLSESFTLRSEYGSSQIQNGWKIDFSEQSLIGRSRGHRSKARASPIRGGEFGVLNGSSCGDSFETSLESSVRKVQRRELVGVISSWTLLGGVINAGSASRAAAAEDDEQSLETVVPPSKTGLVEKLLERSKANKARYDQERLEAYYKRNFKDYFEFLKGTIENKDKDTLTEAEKGILTWLEKNQ